MNDKKPALAQPPTSDEREDFSKAVPAEQGWYWHWNGDFDFDPVPTSVMKSLANGKCFVSMGQLGLERAVDCDEYGGLWCEMTIPVPVHTAAQPPTSQLVVEIARELYDRFVMGGWEPPDAYAWLKKILAERRGCWR